MNWKLKMNIHFVIHEEFEGPAAFDVWVNKRGFNATYTRIYQYESLPTNIDDLDLLIVLGGPQDPATTTQTCHYFDVKAEIAFIKNAIERKVSVIGVCLGAQLIGEALGAHYAPSPKQEIGCFEISLTESGKADGLFNSFPNMPVVGHWHQDMPGLTPSSQILATSQGCPRQIVKYQQRVYGFQCHLELTTASIESLILASGLTLEQSQEHSFIQSPHTLREYDFTAMNQLLYQFLDALTLAYSNSKRNT